MFIIIEYIKNSWKEYVNIFGKMKKRQYVNQFVTFGMIITSALMIWKSLMLITNCEGPIAVVLTGSMEPGFKRGDLLFFTDYESINISSYHVGDVILFKLKGHEIPIVHRIIRLHLDYNGKIYILSKGDNNKIDDRNLYPGKQLWLERKHILGKVQAHLPYVGIISIIINDYPLLKYSIIFFLGLLVITNKE